MHANKIYSYVHSPTIADVLPDHPKNSSFLLLETKNTSISKLYVYKLCSSLFYLQAHARNTNLLLPFAGVILNYCSFHGLQREYILPYSQFSKAHRLGLCVSCSTAAV